MVIQLPLRWLGGSGIFIVTFLALTSCIPPSPPSTGMRVTASIWPQPLVGQAVDYHIEMTTSVWDLPSVILTITLPSGVELVQGDLHWQGSLVKGQIVAKDLTIRVTTPGTWVIGAFTYAQPDLQDRSFYFFPHKRLYIQSSTAFAQVIDDTMMKIEMPCDADLNCGSPTALPATEFATTYPKP
jgi:hypothetical protein